MGTVLDGSGSSDPGRSTPASAADTGSPTLGTLTGTVTSVATGDPIGGICVLAPYSDLVATSILTSANGTYTVTGLTPGTITVIFAYASGCGAPGEYETVTDDLVVITAVQTTTLNASLQTPSGTPSGIVTSTPGALRCRVLV